MIVWTRNGRMELAKNFVGTGFHPNRGFEILLFVNDIQPTPLTVFNDLTEANFGGYARQFRTWLMNGEVVMNGNMAEVALGTAGLPFTCTSNPQTIRGWALFDAYTQEIFCVQRYETDYELQIGETHRLYITLQVGKLLAD